MGVFAVNTLSTDMVGTQPGSPTCDGEHDECVLVTQRGRDKFDREVTGRARKGASETAAGSSSVEKGVESNAARIGAGTPIRTTSAHYRPEDWEGGRCREISPTISSVVPLSSLCVRLRCSRRDSPSVPTVGESQPPPFP